MVLILIDNVRVKGSISRCDVKERKMSTLRGVSTLGMKQTSVSLAVSEDRLGTSSTFRRPIGRKIAR